MKTIFDDMLVKIKVQEMLEEASNARADRKVRTTNSQTGGRKFRFVPATIAAMTLWILRKFSAN